MPNPKLETYKNKATGDVYDYTDADAQGKLTAILDGTNIDSFADVESALADKVDAVAGKGLSTNDYDNTAKGIVDNIQSNVIANTKLIKDTVGWSGKNKLKYPYRENSLSENGLTYTANSNGSVSISGTSTSADGEIALHARQLTDKAFYLKKGTYKLSINCADGNIGTYLGTTYNNAFKRICNNITGTNEITFTIDDSTQSDYKLADGSVLIAVYLFHNTIKAFNTVAYPMIRDADILDSTYEPYFGSTAFPRSEQAVLGAKNIIPYPYHSPNSYTSHDVGFTVNTNKTVTTDSGTASGDDAVFTLLQKSDAAFNDFFELTKGKTIKLTGVPEGASTSTYWLMIYDTSAHNLVSGEMEYQMPETMPSAFYLQIVVKNGQSASNKIWKPMISFDGGEYAPPAMTNRELTDRVDNIKYTSNGTSYTVLKQYVVKPTMTFSSGVGTATLYAPAGETIGSFAVACANSDKAVAHVNVSGTTATVTLTDTSYSSTAPVTIIYFTYKS